MDNVSNDQIESQQQNGNPQENTIQSAKISELRHTIYPAGNSQPRHLTPKPQNNSTADKTKREKDYKKKDHEGCARASFVLSIISAIPMIFDALSGNSGLGYTAIYYMFGGIIVSIAALILGLIGLRSSRRDLALRGIGLLILAPVICGICALIF